MTKSMMAVMAWAKAPSAWRVVGQRPAGTQHEDRRARGHDGEEEHSEKELAH
jgi:hypothetical protein